MKKLFTILLIGVTMSMSAQNASFGIGAMAINKDRVNGTYFTGNVRAQFTERLGWQTEVGYATMSEKNIFIETINSPSGPITRRTERGDHSMTIKTSLSAKIVKIGGLTTELIIGGGLYNEDRDLYGLLSGELFLSAQIGKNVTAGIPLAFNFITWRREEFYTAGISVRFHM